METEYLEQNKICSISPVDFEKYCKDILLGYAEKEKLMDFSITHDVKIQANDGVYQIDLYATFRAIGVDFKVICECKRYKKRVDRDKIVILADKVKSIGAQKGILLSTSGFQSGAIRYAKQHGIALIQVFDKGCEFYSHLSGIENYEENDPFLYGEKLLSPYRAIDCTSNTDGVEGFECVYPTRSMIYDIYAEMSQLIEKLYGMKINLPKELKRVK